MAGFMTSSCALSVFSVEDLDIKDETQDQVQKYAFSQTMEVPDSDALEGVTRSGWVGLGDAQDVDFKFPVFMPPYMAFTLRTDSKKANAKAVKAVLAERIAAEGSPVSRQRKKELKEMVTLEELKKTPWLPTTTDCILDLDKRRLYIASVSESSINEVLTLFERTFGVHPVDCALAVTDMGGQFAEAFRRSVTLDNNVSVYADGCSVELQGEGENAEGGMCKSTVRVENNDAAVLHALENGLHIVSMRLASSMEGQEDIEEHFSLTGALRFPKVKLPKPERGGDDTEEMVQETTFLLHANTLANIADTGIRFAAV